MGAEDILFLYGGSTILKSQPKANNPRRRPGRAVEAPEAEDTARRGWLAPRYRLGDTPIEPAILVAALQSWGWIRDLTEEGIDRAQPRP
eukprot:3078868-Prymnesium_polylepis.1